MDRYKLPFIRSLRRKQKLENIERIANELVDTLKRKNHDYGNSFEKLMDEFGDITVLIRLSDKLERLKSLQNKEAKVTDESKKDTLLDIAGYSLLALSYMEGDRNGIRHAEKVSKG